LAGRGGGRKRREGILYPPLLLKGKKGKENGREREEKILYFFIFKGREKRTLGLKKKKKRGTSGTMGTKKIVVSMFRSLSSGQEGERKKGKE